MATMRVSPGIEQPARITLVDDVVTKGATLLAAASLVAEAFPGIDVRAFTLVRTMGLVPEIERIVDPVFGRIKTDRGGADRQP
jgi:adenine/guanine phosphoribosyltransferase-like PRPP-binding protein